MFEAHAQVRLIHDPTRVGLLTGITRERRGRKLWQVRWSDEINYQPEDQIELVSGGRLNPIDLMAQKKLGTPKSLRRALTHTRLNGRLADIIYSMEATNTDFYSFQFKPVLKILEAPTNGLLIADEVGLGKTIESGLIWTELKSRFDFRRLVVLCPAALREKWRDELINKIGVKAQIANADDLYQHLNEDLLQKEGFALVCSQQGLRPPKGWEEGENRSVRAKLASLIDDKTADEPLIDLLVIDEAHHMRNSETKTHELGKLLRGVADYLLLLTATPIHNKNTDLFSLLNILDEDTFETPDNFFDILYANGPLVKARDKIFSEHANPKEVSELIKSAMNYPLLRGNRQLQGILEKLEGIASLNDHKTKSDLAYKLETANLLGHAITRTRKRDVKENKVIREPHPDFINMTEKEEEFYNAVTGTIRKYAEARDIHEAFLLAMPQRQMASCMPAALQHWQRLEVDFDETDVTGTEEEDEENRRRVGPLTQEIIRNLPAYANYNTLYKEDTKFQGLLEILKAALRKNPKEKIIVFSTFRGTLAYLGERLRKEKISSIILQGGGSETKAETISKFQAEKGPNILLSSEVGGEGVDLQFAWIVINYDLPWNPMRVEQRIGRVDRLGQKSKKVLIWNLFFADTIDAKIYEKLYVKLDLCRQALGDFEAVLGEEISKLTLALLTQELTPDQENSRIEQTSIALENIRKENETLEQEAATLVAYGDYILNQIKAAHDMKRWITTNDLVVYVEDFLNTYFPGSNLRLIDQEANVFEVKLSTDCKIALQSFGETKNLSRNSNLLYSGAKTVKVIFSHRLEGGMKKGFEVISQFHPLIRFANGYISSQEREIKPAVSIALEKQKDLGLPSGQYLVSGTRWSIQGLQTLEKLAYAGCNLNNPNQLLSEDLAEQLAITAAIKGKSWYEWEEEIGELDITEIANNELFGHLDEEFKKYLADITARNEDRADIQERNCKSGFEKGRTRKEELIERLKREGKDRAVKLYEAQVLKLKEREAFQLERIKERRNITYNTDEFFAAIVKIV